MIKFQETEVWGFRHAIRGARNPLHSHHKSDTYFKEGECFMGENDLKLLKSLAKAGSSHRKYLRQIIVSVDITAPRFWWAEEATYKIGTVENSESTMHTIHKREINLNDFSCDNFNETEIEDFQKLIDLLNSYREQYLGFLDLAKNKDIDEVKRKEIMQESKRYWRLLIETLPASYNQKRTCTFSYETLFNMYQQRYYPAKHKLVEWHGFGEWCDNLPYFKELLVD